MRRFLAVSALVVLVVAAFALTDAPVTVHAASNSGNLTLAGVSDRLAGCPLGPAYTFCDQPPNTSSFPALIVLDNSAAVNGVSVSLAALPGLAGDFAAGDFTVSSTSCTGSLAANTGCQIYVQFSPTTAGLRAAALTTTDSEGDSVTVNIEGTGKNLAIAPPYTLSTSPADNSFGFASAPVNPSSPQAQNFSITAGASVSQITLSLAAIPGLESEFANGGADFSLVNNCGALAAGGSCTATVRFTPTAVGLRSAALIASDSQGDTSTVYISGYGTSGNGGNQAGGLTAAFGAPASVPCALVNVFGFCNEPAGGVSPIAGTFTVQNASNTQITGLTVPKGSMFAQGATAPDFTVQSTSCASVLAAGATCDVTVAFTPTTSGLRQGAIVVSDAQGDVAAVNLAGYGDDYNITTQLPTELSVIPGNSVTFNATLTPDSVFGMNGEQVTFVCPGNLPANTSCVATPCPAAITPGTLVSVQVKLATSSATLVAPVPTSKCSSYGPSVPALIAGPPLERQSPPAAAPGGAVQAQGLSSAELVFAALGAVGLLLLGFSALAASGTRKRTALIIMCAGLAAALLAGCHHHGATTTTATPNATTTLTLFGNAIDATGNSLNASRQFQVTLDVVTK